jgi:hypothetical protein
LSLTMPIPGANQQNMNRNDSRMQWKSPALSTLKYQHLLE